jgi:hypothetical protein
LRAQVAAHCLWLVRLMTYHVRLILHQVDSRPCCDVDNPYDDGVSLVWIYGPNMVTPGDNGPFPCRHGKPSVIRTCTLEIPLHETDRLPDDRE